MTESQGEQGRDLYVLPYALNEIVLVVVVVVTVMEVMTAVVGMVGMVMVVVVMMGGGDGDGWR